MSMEWQCGGTPFSLAALPCGHAPSFDHAARQRTNQFTIGVFFAVQIRLNLLEGRPHVKPRVPTRMLLDRSPGEDHTDVALLASLRCVTNIVLPPALRDVF